jgi:predicted phosphodiesterase
MNDNEDLFHEVRKLISLENTRLIYDYVEDLARRHIDRIWRKFASGSERYKGIANGFEEIKESVLTAIKDAIIEDKDKENNANLLRQNPLYSFLTFFFEEGEISNLYEKILKVKIKDETDSKIKKLLKKLLSIAEMVHLYLLVYLQNDGWTEASPYIYEDICTSMCEILGYKNCYIVMLKDSKIKIVQQCSTFINEKTRLFEKKLRESHSELYEKIENASKTLDKTVFFYDDLKLKDEKEKEIKYSIASINIKSARMPLHEYENDYVAGENNDYGIDNYFVLNNWSENEAVSSENEAVKKEAEIINHELAGRVLFLHRTLSDNLARDHHALMNLRDNFDYVERLSEDMGEKDVGFVAMHISDLHIDKAKWIDAKNIKTQDELKAIAKLNDHIKKQIDSYFNDRKQRIIDLLFVTGDIIHGQATAKQMEDNYGVAEGVIFMFAEKLWGKGERLRADWKKRVLIVPGNQDYSSMNESKTAIEDRQTIASGVTKKPGSTMSRFAYFIDFMRRRLDINLDFIDDKLNYIRKYKGMKSTFICLNSCAAINPKRNNKVNLDFEITEKLKEQLHIENAEQQRHTKYLIMHHTPRYVFCDMDYYKDGFGWPESNAYFKKKSISGSTEYQEKEAERIWNENFNLAIPHMLHREKVGIPDKALFGELGDIIKEYNKKIDKEPGIVAKISSNIMSDYMEVIEDKYDFLLRLNLFFDLLKKNKEQNGIEQNEIHVFGGHTHKVNPLQPIDVNSVIKSLKKFIRLSYGKADTKNVIQKFIDKEIKSIAQKLICSEAGKLFNTNGDMDKDAILVYPD